METLREIIGLSEPLLLFLVIGVGFMIGQIRIHGFKLGVAGVLFVGLLFGGWRAEGQISLSIAHQVMQVGLILFVYTVGLTSGSGFFSALKSRGLRFNTAIVCALTCGALATFLAGKWMNLHPEQIAGVFCGGLTNTPALAAVTELVHNTGIGDPSDPAVGYSMTYPFGIIGGLLAFQVFAWILRKPLELEQADAEVRSRKQTSLVSANFEIRNPELFDKPIGQLRVQEKTGLIISRQRHGDTIEVPTKYSVLHEGDVITTIGAEAKIQEAENYFGARSTEHIEEISGKIVIRRILVSHKKVAGRSIRKLELDRRFNAQITRLRRVDFDFVPDHDTVIQMGDRVRVIMPSDRAKEVTAFFGDSERGISELDYTALTLGISAGVLLGMIPIPIPGGTSVSLGFAGGPLVAGLILGKLGRTGPLVWALPSESNNALRHIGLLFFLAAVGVMAGGRFFEAFAGDGGQLFILGLITTTVTTGLALLLLRLWGKGTVVECIGATSGMQTQPATLARAYEMSKSEDTYVSYATTYPIAMVGKILIAQLLVILGNMLAQ
ncbi:MAG: transporter [Candidatus Zixiibacteriota bacterium]|nr:MAG: transporter [candidate division Zixibacteria bacterium]